jgi:C_GCAxxG_C_C family probable redox protein
MSHRDSATACFKSGFNCSQAVLSAFAAELGLDREAGLRVAAAFGGGMGRMGGTCGAVTGALMALGLKYGQTVPEDKEAKERTYALAREFVARFQARHGSTICRELLGYDVSTPEGMQAVREKGLHDSVCVGLVGDSAEIVEQMLSEG